MYICNTNLQKQDKSLTDAPPCVATAKHMYGGGGREGRPSESQPPIETTATTRLGADTLTVAVLVRASKGASSSSPAGLSSPSPPLTLILPSPAHRGGGAITVGSCGGGLLSSHVIRFVAKHTVTVTTHSFATAAAAAENEEEEVEAHAPRPWPPSPPSASSSLALLLLLVPLLFLLVFLLVLVSAVVRRPSIRLFTVLLRGSGPYGGTATVAKGLTAASSHSPPCECTRTPPPPPSPLARPRDCVSTAC